MTDRPTENGSEEREDALVRFALGELSAEESRAFARRIADDAELAEEAGRLRRTFDLLGFAAATPPPPRLRARVLAAAARPRAPARRPSRWIGRAALAALAASLLVAVVLDDLRLRRELALLGEVTDTLHQPNVVVSFPLRGAGGSAGAYGRAVLDLDAKKAALVVSGLPALPEGEAYWLWALVGEEPVPCGRFEASGDGRIVRQFAIPVKDYTEPVRRLIVTVEPDAEAEEPRGPVVMSSV